MSSRKGSFEPTGLTVTYNKLGSITVDELRHALIEDLNILRDLYNIQYVRPARLKIFPVDEYGREVKLRRPGGGRIHLMDTYHLRPICKDYDL